MMGSLENGAGRASVSADRYLTAPPDGARLRYRDEGRGPAVVFIHGWTLDLEMWDPQVASLHERFRCIRLDRRGFGLSGGMPSLQQDVRDVLTLCRFLEIKRFACVGMSQGSRVALHLAREAPALLSCVVLDGPPDVFAVAAPDRATVAGLAGAPLPSSAQSMQSFRQQWRNNPLMQLRAADPRNRSLLDRMIDRYPGRDLEAGASADSLPVDAHTLRSIQTPILVIVGEHDLRDRRLAAEELTRALPAAVRADVRAAGHLPNLDNPQAYNQLVGDFLNRCR